VLPRGSVKGSDNNLAIEPSGSLAIEIKIGFPMAR
jgi:hypothetical protein